MSSLAGKTVVITGASSGIGEALARELARRGARLGLVARREERLAALAKEIAAGGGTASWASADVCDTAGLHGALDELDRTLGPVDVAIANAGTNRPEPPQKFEPGRALALYDVNLLGMLRLIDWALPRFLERRSGHLVGIASLASYLGLPHNAAYSGSKAAMRIHLQSLRVSLRGHGVAVTTVCPGFVKSELTVKARFPMPFLWETDRAARLIAGAIEARRGEVTFPWQMSIPIKSMARLPTWLAERLLRRMG